MAGARPAMTDSGSIRFWGSGRLGRSRDLPTRRPARPRARASVLAQEGARFELIVVDDASTDATGAYLATLADPRIRVIAAERNLCPSGARILGLSAARAEVVAFLDSDDAYLPGRLAVPLAALASDPDL